MSEKLLKAAGDGWEPEETAPRDGTEFLSINTQQGNLMAVAWYYRPLGYFIATGGQHLYRFTHWQPLPIPPQTTEGK